MHARVQRDASRVERDDVGRADLADRGRLRAACRSIRLKLGGLS